MSYVNITLISKCTVHPYSLCMKSMLQKHDKSDLTKSLINSGAFQTELRTTQVHVVGYTGTIFTFQANKPWVFIKIIFSVSYHYVRKYCKTTLSISYNPNILMSQVQMWWQNTVLFYERIPL